MAKEISVLHTAPAVFGDEGLVGGGERYPLEMARYMAERVPTTLAVFGKHSREERLGNLRIQVIGKPWHVRGQAHNPFAFSLLRHIRKADIVHCHQRHLFMSSATALACRLTGRKVFVSDLGGGGWDISAYVSTERWYHGHLHISQYSRTLSGQANNPRAHVIYGGVDTEKFSPDPALPRTGNALFVGRLLPHKGVNDLVEGLPDGMGLEILGRPYHEQFVSDLHRLAAGKNVVFRHNCDDAEMVRAYRGALCIVLPSVYRTMYGEETKVPELLGQTLLEGMACGTPAICTDVASMPEVVEDGVTGFVVPPNDPRAMGEKLRWLQEHPEEAQAMGLAARQRVLKHFTWPAVVERCLDIYTRCVSA